MNWLLLRWIAEERTMPSGRIYRVSPFPSSLKSKKGVFFGVFLGVLDENELVGMK